MDWAGRHSVGSSFEWVESSAQSRELAWNFTHPNKALVRWVSLFLPKHPLCTQWARMRPPRHLILLWSIRRPVNINFAAGIRQVSLHLKNFSHRRAAKQFDHQIQIETHGKYIILLLRSTYDRRDRFRLDFDGPTEIWRSLRLILESSDAQFGDNGARTRDEELDLAASSIQWR